MCKVYVCTNSLTAHSDPDRSDLRSYHENYEAAQSFPTLMTAEEQAEALDLSTKS